MHIRYRVDSYGNSALGWRFYDTTINIIEATFKTYLSIGLMKLFGAMQLHVWAAFRKWSYNLYKLFVTQLKTMFNLMRTSKGKIADLQGWGVIHIHTTSTQDFFWVYNMYCIFYTRVSGYLEVKLINLSLFGWFLRSFHAKREI